MVRGDVRIGCSNWLDLGQETGCVGYGIGLRMWCETDAKWQECKTRRMSDNLSIVLMLANKMSQYNVLLIIWVFLFWLGQTNRYDLACTCKRDCFERKWHDAHTRSNINRLIFSCVYSRYYSDVIHVDCCTWLNVICLDVVLGNSWFCSRAWHPEIQLIKHSKFGLIFTVSFYILYHSLSVTCFLYNIATIGKYNVMELIEIKRQFWFMVLHYKM